MRCVKIFLEQAGAEVLSRKLESALGLVGGPFLRPLTALRKKFDICRRKCSGTIEVPSPTRRRHCIGQCNVMRLKAELAIIQRASTRCQLSRDPNRCQQIIAQETRKIQNQIENTIERTKRLDQLASGREYAEKTQRIVRGKT